MSLFDSDYDYMEGSSSPEGKGLGIFKLILFVIVIAAIVGVAMGVYYQNVQVGFRLIQKPTMVNTSEATDVGKSSVTLNGELSYDIFKYPAGGVGWFECGPNTSPIFLLKTPNQTLSIPENFSYDAKSSFFFPSQSYKYRAVAVINNTTYYGETKTFTMQSLTPLPERNYGKYAENFTSSENISLSTFIQTIPSPFVDRMGMTFWGVLLGLPFLLMFIRGTNVIIPSILCLCLGGFIWGYMPPEFVRLAYLFMIVAIAGIIYTILKGKA